MGEDEVKVGREDVERVEFSGIEIGVELGRRVGEEMGAGVSDKEGFDSEDALSCCSCNILLTTCSWSL